MTHDLDKQAFDSLVRAHYGRLCDFVYRHVHSREIAEDIVQDLFVRILESGRFHDLDDPLPYLYRAARNGAVSHLRGRRLRERLRERIPRPPTPRRADAEAELRELEYETARAVEALPRRTRLVFSLSRDQGLTYAQIARTLDVSVKTVESQMGRALKLLRQRLAPFLSISFTLISVTRAARLLFP